MIVEVALAETDFGMTMSMGRRANCWHIPRWKVSTSPRTPANLRRALRHLLRMLRSEGIVPPKSMLISEVVSEELQCFDKYLKDVRGLAPATRLYRLRYVREFLLAQFGWGPIALECLKTDDICRFVTDRATGCQPRTAGIIGDCLRSYLRFHSPGIACNLIPPPKLHRPDFVDRDTDG